MSQVTDVVIHYGSSDGDMTEHLTEQQEFMDFTGLLHIPYGLAGGIKAFQGDIYAGAFNYLNAEALADWFLKLPWPADAHAVMSLSVENESFGLMVLDRGTAEWSVHPATANKEVSEAESR